MMIYIQSDTSRSLPHHFDAACVLYGAMDAGEDFRLTTLEEIQNGKFDALLRTQFAAGSTDFMQAVFTRLGKTPALPAHSDRPYEIMRLDSARALVETGKKIFIKPVQPKLFSGTLFDRSLLTTLQHLDGATEVIVFEPFSQPIRSEWRAYVHRGKIVDCRHYAGDFRIAPDYALLEKKIAALKNFPCAYTADTGILTDGTNHIIEFNDMWAIGNYGMENTLYLQLLRDRYAEIVR